MRPTSPVPPNMPTGIKLRGGHDESFDSECAEERTKLDIVFLIVYFYLFFLFCVGIFVKLFVLSKCIGDRFFCKLKGNEVIDCDILSIAEWY